MSDGKKNHQRNVALDGQDMTLALTKPDNVQKDKRYHGKTSQDTLKFMTRNTREQHD